MNNNKVLRIIFTTVISLVICTAKSDTIPSALAGQLQWRAGFSMSPSYVPGTNDFIKGINSEHKTIHSNLSGSINFDFSFNPESRDGLLYPGLYQGAGIGVNTGQAENLVHMLN